MNNNLKLITDHKDYFFLYNIDKEDKYSLLAHLPKHKDAPLLEGVLLLPKWWKEIVECTDNTDLERTIKIGERFENCSKDGGVTINKNGWWTFPTYNRWKVVNEFPELPKQEEDVEQLAKDAAQSFGMSVGDAKIYTDGYKAGWADKAASQKRWSDEQVRKAMLVAMDYGNGGSSKDRLDFITNYLQSLSPVKTPVGFEPEYIDMMRGTSGKEAGADLYAQKYSGENRYQFKTIKSTYNGKEVEILCGRWIYE